MKTTQQKVAAEAELAQRRTAITAHHNPRDGAQAGPAAEPLAAQLQASTRMTAQRQQIEAAFGPAVQREAEDEELQMKAQPGTVQRVGPEEEEPVQGKFGVAQRADAPQEEELLQGRFAHGPVAQLQGPEEEELLQGRFSTPAAGVAQAVAVPNAAGSSTA